MVRAVRWVVVVVVVMLLLLMMTTMMLRLLSLFGKEGVERVTMPRGDSTNNGPRRSKGLVSFFEDSRL
jgi:hypothetical protein